MGRKSNYIIKHPLRKQLKIHGLYESLVKITGLGYTTQMTCIVGIADQGIIYMGGDRAASDGSSIVSLATPKIYIRDEWIFGYAGSMGVGQIMQIIDIPILKKDDDPFMILRMDMVDSFKYMLDHNGITLNDENETDILIGCRGRLFEFSPTDWSVAEIKETAIGSGGNFALGSLYTTQEFPITPEFRMEYALNAAITYSPTCQGPFDILYI
jgi:ATP-dependent protease HslVU (ClpYQ) peptidase subunit